MAFAAWCQVFSVPPVFRFANVLTLFAGSTHANVAASATLQISAGLHNCQSRFATR
jgi:hypothetical protein